MKGKKIRAVVIFLLFIVYFILAARPVPQETILSAVWISSLLAENPQTSVISASADNVYGDFIPFTLGNRFGYVNSSGEYAINRVKNNNIYLGGNFWTEYETQPAKIEVKSLFDELLINIENTRGYPILLDNRVFILGNEQNELSEIDSDGNVIWTYEFGAPITCIDAAAGLVLTGSLDGVIEILDSFGKRIFYFKPGGSRYDVILGCAVSGNGSRLGIICGVDNQRFLYLERFGNTGGEYRVIYHEYLETGFRRPVRVLFTDEDRRIVFERAGGINCYNIKARHGVFIPLDGKISAIDNSGDQGLIFLITSDLIRRNELIGIKLPEYKRMMLAGKNDTQGAVFLRASFNSDDVFLGRNGSKLIIGGGSTLISFDLEDK